MLEVLFALLDAGFKISYRVILCLAQISRSGNGLKMV